MFGRSYIWEDVCGFFIEDDGLPFDPVVERDLRQARQQPVPAFMFNRRPYKPHVQDTVVPEPSPCVTCPASKSDDSQPMRYALPGSLRAALIEPDRWIVVKKYWVAHRRVMLRIRDSRTGAHYWQEWEAR